MSSVQQNQMDDKVTTSHLRQNWVLLKTIRVNDILGSMTEESLITVEQSRAILSEKTESKQAEDLLYHVFPRPQQYLDSFLMILAKNGYEHIVQTLREDSTRTALKENSTAFPSTEETQNVAQSNVVPVDKMKLLLKEAVSELKNDIKEAQEVVQRDIAEFKRDREDDRKRYEQLQEQYIKLKETNENTIRRLKKMNIEKYELTRILGKLETERYSLQQQIQMLKKRQSRPAVKQSEIESKEKEIESFQRKISELEEMIALGQKKHKKDALQIRDLKEQIEKIKEMEKIKEKEAPVKGKNEVLNEAEDVKERNDNLTANSQSIRSGMQSGRDFTVQPISLDGIKGKSIGAKVSRQSDMRRSYIGPHQSQNYGRYNVLRQQTFAGTSLPQLSHNSAYKKGQVSSSKGYRK